MKQNFVRFFFITFICSIFSILVFLLVVSIPESTINISKTSKVNLANILPQGWAFFTRNPQEENVYIYNYEKIKHNEIEQLILHTGSIFNLFGFNRKSRLQSQDLGYIVANLPDTAWTTIKGDFNSNLGTILGVKVFQISTAFKYPYFQGYFLLQKKYPIPWAWYRNFDNRNQVSKIAIINVQKFD